MGNQSARQVTGVGPRHAFTFNGTGSNGNTVDQVIGVDLIVKSTAALGKWDVTHNLGHTGYCVQFFPEHTTTNDLNMMITERGTTNCKLECENQLGAYVNPTFVHGVIYD